MFKKVHFSEDGSNDRVKEESAYMMFLDYLDECEKGIDWMLIARIDNNNYYRVTCVEAATLCI